MPTGVWAKSNTIFGVDNSSLAHTDNRKKDILVLGERPTDGLDDTTIAANAKYSFNITKPKKICLSLRYNAANKFLYANGVKIHQFKAQGSDIKPYPLCLGNILKDFAVDNMKKTRLNAKVYDYCVSYETIDVGDILNTPKFMMKKYCIL